VDAHYFLLSFGLPEPRCNNRIFKLLQLSSESVVTSDLITLNSFTSTFHLIFRDSLKYISLGVTEEMPTMGRKCH